MRRAYIAALASLLAWLILTPQLADAQSSTPTPTTPPLSTVNPGQCSSFDFPYGAWQISSGVTIGQTSGYLNAFGSIIEADVTLPYTYDLYTITIDWNPGTILGFREWGNLSVDTFIAAPGSQIEPVEFRNSVFNDNASFTQKFYFTKPANTLKILLQRTSSLIPMYMKVMAICAKHGGNNPPLPDVPSATPTDPPSQTPGGSTATNTPVPSTPTASRTPTPSNTRPPSQTPTTTVGPGTGTNTAAPSSTGTITATSNYGNGSGVIDSGAVSTPQPPSRCGSDQNPCGANPFMPNGVAPFDTPALVTFVPITAVPGQPTSTLIAGPYCPTASSGPTNTPCPTQTPNLTQTPSDLQGQISEYATNVYEQGQSIMVTPGLNAPDGSGYIDLANSGNEIGSFAGDFFGLVRAVQTFFLGKTGSIVAILLLILGFTLFVNLLLYAIPILISLFKLFMQIVSAILGIIP